MPPSPKTPFEPASLSVRREKIRECLPSDSTALELRLPQPALHLDFRLCVQLDPKVSVGVGPWGHRNWISFSGGHWSATWANGTVVPGGQDSQIVNPTTLATHVDTNYLLQTSDNPPAYIVVKTEGWRTGDRDVLEKLFDPALADGVDASEYTFRLYVKFETGDERYMWVNEAMWLGSGARRRNEVIYDGFRVD